MTTVSPQGETVARHETTQFDFREGEVLCVHKPVDWTSFDVVKKVKNLFHIEKIGHAGTLDPKATGLLILCTGKRTKAIEEFKDFDKEYEGDIELGAWTRSFDSETEIEERRSIEGITEADLHRVFKEFVGVREQIPPMYSAVKYGGKPLYHYARRGREVVRQPRSVEITVCDVTAIALPLVSFRIVCSRGTYIRSLAHEIGEQLGCGAFLHRLIRTRVGAYRLENAWTLEELIRLALNRANE
jgi:tRNA pseudouridine55 synthase